MFISVLMAVYNGETYLREAVDSILAQTYTNFEFIIVNDGSTDTTANILASYTDARIQVINSPQNLGLIDSLNKGILAAKGEYIARLDADDIAIPERLEKQVKYLSENPEIVLLGSGARIIDAKGNVITDTYYQHEKDCIPIHLLFRNIFIHSSIIVKTKILAALQFDKSYYLAEDYIVWVQIAEKYKTDSVKESLVKHRVHETNITKLKYDKHIATVQQIHAYQLKKLGIEPDIAQVTLHGKIGSYQFENTINYLEQASLWLVLLLKQNRRLNIYQQTCLENRILLFWVDMCLQAKNLGFGLVKLFIIAEISSFLPLTRRLKVIVKLLSRNLI
jgi:glycosyltransferase involved in cell wall biosynthesis